MEIRPIVNPIAEFLDGEDSAEADSWLAQKTTQLLTFFHIIVPDISNEEEQMVDDAIIKTYASFGITHDNNSVYTDETKSSLKVMPLIQDLHDTLCARQETARVAKILARFVTGSLSNFNNYTNVDLDNKFIVFGLDDLQGQMKAVGMFIVMDFLWGQIKKNRTERKAVFIDEGWQLLGASGDDRAADFVYRIFKIIRGYCGSAIFATQDITDLFAFKDGKYGKAIISNSRIKVVLGLEPQEAKYVQEILQLTDNEVRSITNFERGEGLICANNNKVPVYIRASRLEDELFTTDPNQIRAIVQQRKEEAARSAFSRGVASPGVPHKQQATRKSPAAPHVDSVWGRKPAAPRPSLEELPMDAQLEIHAAEQSIDATAERQKTEQQYGSVTGIETVRWTQEDFSEEEDSAVKLAQGRQERSSSSDVDPDLTNAPSAGSRKPNINHGGDGSGANHPPSDF